MARSPQFQRWLDEFRPVRFGRRLAAVPPTVEGEPPVVSEAGEDEDAAPG